MLDFEGILVDIGQFGHGQRIQFCLLCLPVFFASFISLDITLIAGTPKHWCQVNNDTRMMLRQQLDTNKDLNMSFNQAIEALYPKNKKDKSCYIYDDVDLKKLQRNVKYTKVNDSSSSLVVSQKLINSSSCSKWEYSKEVFDTTIVNEWNLVCGQYWKRTALKTVFFAGRLVGAVVFGQISDLIGRLPTLILAIVLNIISGLGNSFSPEPWVFGIFVFLQGMVQVGFMLTSYVLANEMIGPVKRKWAANIMQSAYALGYAIMPWISLLFPNWRHLVLVMQLPTALFLVFYFVVLESPRWLLAKGRNEEALKIIEKVALRNKKELKQEWRDEVLNHKDPAQEQKYTAINLFTSGAAMLLLTLNVWFNWMINSLIYYGLALNAENLAGNFYLNLSMMGLLEFPAYIVSVALLDVIGRKKLLISTMILAGLSCIATGYMPKSPGWGVTTVAMLGKFFVTISYGVIYFVTVEVFPTVVRNIGMGMASMSARAGGLLAAPIIDLGQLYEPAPVLVFGGLAILAAILAFALPETKGQPMIQTIEEFQNRHFRQPREVQLDGEQLEPLKNEKNEPA